MQEDRLSNAEEPATGLPWKIILPLLGLIAILCLAACALVYLIIPEQVLPTAVARVELAIPTQLPLGTSPEPGNEAESANNMSVTKPPPVAQSGGRSAGDPYIPELGNTGYDVQRYILQLALDPVIDHVEGTTTIEAVATLHGLAQLYLDFAGFEVGSVTVNGFAVPFTRESKKLIVDLPAPLPAESPFSLVITYSGKPLYEQSPFLRFADHLGLHYPDQLSLFTIAEPDGARYWFPANDHPQDKAAFRFELVVPQGLVAVANGRLLESRPGILPNDEQGELYIWEHNYPMAPYLALVAAGQYETISDRSADGIPLRHYVFPELREEFLPAADEAGQAIDWMSDLFGPYPFEAFGFVTARIPGGSMETQTMVLLSDAMIGKRTAVHELTHMWFGNWVSLASWSEMWRNEGFATYFQIMWETRDDPEALELQMASLASVVEGNDKDYPLNQPPPEFLFELNVYFKGALAVHALRQEMGDEAFFAGLRTYFDRFGGNTASDAQFRAVMEEASGRSLAPYFAEWFPAVPGDN